MRAGQSGRARAHHGYPAAGGRGARKQGRARRLEIPVGCIALQQANLNRPQPEADVTRQALGLNLTGLSDEARKRFGVKESVKGVLVTRVDPNSNAADKRIQAGDVIVEVGQEAVTSPADVTRRIDQIKKDGRKSALLLVSNKDGEVRFVALSLE